VSTPEQLWGALAGENQRALGQVLGSGPSPRVPFVLAGHLRTEVSGDGLRQRQELIDAVVHAPPVLVEVDPRLLRATQGGLDREGVVHYLGTVFHERGITYADHHDPGNADPVVLVRERDGAHLLLAGHHRATAALLRGVPLLARVVGGDPDRRDTLHPTQGVSYGSVPPTLATALTADVAVAVAAVRAGGSVHVPDGVTARQVLGGLGLADEAVTARLHYAATGSLRGSSPHGSQGR